MTPIQRNRDNIQFAGLRKKVDPKFETLHDTLSAAYYDHWKYGNSMPWQSYDVQSTPEESKALFDKLHGLIFHERQVEFHNENLKTSVKDQISEDEYNIIKDKDGNILGKVSDETDLKIAQLKTEGFEINKDI